MSPSVISETPYTSGRESLARCSLEMGGARKEHDQTCLLKGCSEEPKKRKAEKCKRLQVQGGGHPGVQAPAPKVQRRGNILRGRWSLQVAGDLPWETGAGVGEGCE